MLPWHKNYYHQSPETGFKLFTTGETIQEVDGNGEGVMESFDNNAEVDRLTGDVLYLDNRACSSTNCKPIRRH